MGISGMRFVLLRHEMPAGADRRSHFDLMLENEDRLWTWSLDEFPNIGDTVDATRLSDHRKIYLEYEGEVSDNRGTVSRVLSGIYEPIKEEEQVRTMRLGVRDIVGHFTETFVVEIEWVAPEQTCTMRFS